MKPIVIFDTNTVISAALLSRSVTRLMFDRALASCTIVCSELCFQELSEVITRPKFRKYIDKKDAQLFIADYAKKCLFINVTHTVTDCRDPKDNKFFRHGTYCFC